MTVVVYASKNGSTKRYAKKMARELKLELYEYSEYKDEGDDIIYFGAVYNEKVLGLDDFLDKHSGKIKSFHLITVGLLDLNIRSNALEYEDMLKNIRFRYNLDFRHDHLKGAIDYSKLSFIDKLMIKYKISKTDNANRKLAFALTYNKWVDYSDANVLKMIVQNLI